MLTDQGQRKLIKPIIISLFLHLGVLKALEFLPKNLFSYTPTPISKSEKPLEVRSISRRDMKKYRTVGLKNGEKNFSLPNKLGDAGEDAVSKPAAVKVKPAKKVAVKNETPKRKKTKKEISFNSLRVKPKDKIAPTVKTKMKTLEKKQDKSSKLEITTNNAVDYQRTKEVQTDVLKQLAVSPDNAKVLRKTGFNMKLEPPKGVSENELNTMEKIFYSFQRRTFRTYVGSFLKNYQKTLTNRPIVKETLREDLHSLAARVIFDKEGNIISIKILRSSHSDEIHDMFEETLKDMRKLPNPPKDLLSKSGQFTIYYQLKIN